MEFFFIKRINTIKNSIFYSFIKCNNDIIGFGRKYYGVGREVKKIVINEDFDIIEDNNIVIKGEDPRCFEFNNKIYILDNFLNDMYLIEYETNKSIKLNIGGKNLSFFAHNNTLYFIHYIKPFELYSIDLESGTIVKIEVDDDKLDYNYEYRGGTPGYKLTDTTYYGLGHRTYTKNNRVVHDIFKWELYFDNDKLPRISHINIKQPMHSKNICDPTCIIELNHKKYLITAESDKEWFCEQDYITNVYEIITL